MKSLDPALQAYLEEGTTTLAWCWRIARADDVTFGFTDHDRTLSFDGTDFEPESGLTASEVRSGSDLSVDAQDAEGVADLGPDHRDRHPRWALGQCRGRGLARELGRHRPARADATRGHRRDQARAAGLRGGGALARPCPWPDGGADVPGDLLRDRAFTASGLSGFEAGLFTFGTVEWTSGANAGHRTEVLGHDVTDGIAVLTLLEVPARVIAEGDGFTIRAGCDKRIETCGAKFANTANFRGFPHISGQDAVLRYATKDGGHEGSVL